MSTSTMEQPKTAAVKAASQIVPIKVGIYGAQGCGKTTSAALLSLALSKEVYNGAPVWVTDTEPGWQFLKPLFAIEGVELIQTTTPTFKAMLTDLREAEKRGCCVWAIDSLTIIWQEILKSAKGNRSYIPIDQWGDIKAVWNQYTNAFLNSAMCTFALGRLGNEMEEIQDDSGKVTLMKTATKFKAGGGESFGYEPHLLLEMSIERKAKKKAGVKLEGEGRMIHRVDVLKDRTWALNGAVIRWTDKAGYEKGGFRTVWQSIKPHFDRVQQSMARVQIQTGESSSDLFNANGNSDWAVKKERRQQCSAEITELLDHLVGGSSADAKHLRREVTRSIFGVLSKENAADMSLEKVERGWKILQAFERRCKSDVNLLGTSESNILAHLDIDIKEFDEGVAADNDMPF